MHSNCQVCGNPMFGYKDMGLNKDGSINRDYCTSCYRFGKFTRDMRHQNNEFTNMMAPIVANAYGNGIGMGTSMGVGMIGAVMPLDGMTDDSDSGYSK